MDNTEKYIHKGHRDRIKDKYINFGLDSFDDHEVLELLLFYAYPRVDTNNIAHKMIQEFGSLYNLLESTPLEIMKKCNVSKNVAVLVSLIPHISRTYLKRKWEHKDKFNNTKELSDYVKSLFIGRNYECFYILCLDSKYKLINSVLVGSGTIDSATIYPRNILEIALQYKASIVALAHNHPSGDLNPSKADINTTNSLIKALNFIDIKVIDHIIVAGDNYFSFREYNLIN